MDEFFDNMFYYNQRLRVTSYSLILLLSAGLFIPYYLELDKFNNENIKINNAELEDSRKIKIMSIDIYIESAFVVIWFGIAVSSLLMIICIGACKMHKGQNKNMISWISSILLITGSALLVNSYIVQNANKANDKHFDIDDPLICYHFLVCAECWIVAVDGIVNDQSLKKYQRI